MVDTPIEVLLVEDNSGDARLLQEALAEVDGEQFKLMHVKSLTEALEIIEGNDFNIILLDLGLPESKGLDTFIKMQAKIPDAPIIVLTGLDDETVAVKAVHEGAQDYLVKGQVDGKLLVRAMRYAIERHHLKNELKKYTQKLEDELAEFEKKFNIEPKQERSSAKNLHYSLKPGYGYLVREKKTERSFGIFKELVTHDHQGLVITIQSPEELKQRYGFMETPVLRLSKQKFSDEIINATNVSHVMFVIKNFEKKADKGVILLDGMEYLIAIHGFNKIVQFTQDVYEVNMITKSNLIVPINPLALEEREMAVLERYFEAIIGDRGYSTL